MESLSFRYDRNKTMDVETKNDEKVFIKIPLKNGGFWQKEYLQNDLIEKVAKDFKEENHVDIPEDYFMDWNFKDKSLKMTDKLKTLLNQEIPTVCINQTIKRKPLKINKEDILPEVVGKPFNEPFEVFLFTKVDKSLKIQTYDPTIVNNLSLNDYSPSSSYCNGNNHLFISGGENKNGEIIDKFWEIDLNAQNIAEPVKIPPKKNHSMIFIPNNYVFIVGGNDKNTFYFNTESAEVCEWANLNNIRTEPALQRVSNNLYCFDNINKGNNDIFTVEKTDLNSHKPEWILLTPKMNFSPRDNQKLNQKFFGVSKDEEENIIFLGGNMDNPTQNNELFNYKYNTNLNEIEASKVPYRKYNFKEKTFLPYKKNIDFILPDFNKQHPEVVFFVKNKNKIEPINYEPKLNSQLKSLKPPEIDNKYDFNMPSVAIPDPINNFHFDHQHIIQINEQPNKIDSKNENNLVINNDPDNKKDIIEKPTNFQEPEIEPTKEDIKLSLEIPKNLIKNELKEEINLRNNPNNNINNTYVANSFNHQLIPPQSVNIQDNKYYTNIPNYNREVVIPKFHHSVNDPGNELKISSKRVITNQNNNNNILPDSNEKNIQLNPIINPEYKFSGNIKGIEANPPNINIKGSKNSNIEINGTLPGTGINLNGPKIDINGPKVNYNFKGLDVKKDVNLKGTISGTKTNVKKVPNKNFILTGDIPGTKIDQPKVELKGPNTKIDLKGPDINLNEPKINIDSSNMNLKNKKKENNPSVNINNTKIPDFNLSGNIPGRSVKTQNVNVNLKNQPVTTYNLNINNNVTDIKLNDSKVNLSSGKKDLDPPKPKNINYNLNGNIPGLNTSKINMPQNNNNKTNNEYNITGVIPGINPNEQKMINVKYKNIHDYNLNGNIPGTVVNNQKIVIPQNDIEVKGQRRISPNKRDTYLTGIIQGAKPKSQIVETPQMNINIDTPQVNSNITGINTTPPKYEPNILNYDISGNIPGIKLKQEKIVINSPAINNNANINLKGPKIEKNNNEIKINSPQINSNVSLSPNTNVTGTIKGTQINKPKYRDVNITGTIHGTKLNTSKVQNPSVNTNINLNNPNIEIKSPNINIPSNQIEKKDNNIKGNSQTIQIPKADLYMPNNVNNYNISGSIPGINNPNKNKKKNNQNNNNPNNTKKDFFISGIIPSTIDNKDDNNYKVISPDVQFVNNNNKNNNNSRDVSPNKKSFHGNLNDPNYIDYQDIKGSRRPLYNIPTDNIDIPRPNKNINNINGIKIIDEKDVVIQEPYNINNQLLLQNKPKNSNNNNDVNLVVTNMQIQPEENFNISQNLNNIQIQRSSDEYYAPEKGYNKPETNYNNISLQKSHIDIKIDNGIENKFEYNNNDSKNNYIINSDDIHINNPKVDMNINNNEKKDNIPKFNESNNKQNNLNNHQLTDLRFKPIEENNIGDNNNNYGDMNIYSDGRNRTNEENSKKSNNLPLVGSKNNDFKSSKIDYAGDLNTENIDVNNLKSANVGVNGVKMGDRIIE